MPMAVSETFFFALTCGYGGNCGQIVHRGLTKINPCCLMGFSGTEATTPQGTERRRFARYLST